MTTAEDAPHLRRHLGLVQSTALNMLNMIGVGPFITLPLLLTAMNGPQAMLGWVVALCVALPDGMVWSELGAAIPGSGGTYGYLRTAFGERFGRLAAFLFIWQFILSGPLEIASGYIGFANYLGYVWPGMTRAHKYAVILTVGALNVVLLYRTIRGVGRITIALWIGVLFTIAVVLALGFAHFDARKAFDFPPGAFDFGAGFALGLGAAARVGVYDYLGYYNSCYLGDEIRDPGKNIPRSVIISLLLVALIYFGINLSVTGVVSWREFVPAETTRPVSDFVVSIFVERLLGHTAASVFTWLILWTAFGSVFVLLLGYSRIPYAAAVDGTFFKAFGKLHPRKDFPHVSLVVIGVASIACSFFPLDTVIAALLATRIFAQFLAQIVALTVLRRTRPDMPRPYRMWLYPLPSLLALAGWAFILVTTPLEIVAYGVGTLLLGVVAYKLTIAAPSGAGLEGRQQ